MNKAKALLKKVGLFEKLAIYGDRKSFLKAIAQIPPLNIDKTSKYLYALQQLAGITLDPVTPSNVESLLNQLSLSDAKDPSKKALFDTYLKSAKLALDEAKANRTSNLAEHIPPEENVIDIDKEPYAPGEYAAPGDTGDSGMSASEYDKMKREYWNKTPQQVKVPVDVQEKLGLSGMQLTGVMDKETKRRLDAFKLYHKLPASMPLNQLFSKIRTESNEEIYDEGFGEFPSSPTTPNKLLMKQDTKLSSRKMREILKKYADVLPGSPIPSKSVQQTTNDDWFNPANDISGTPAPTTTTFPGTSSTNQTSAQRKIQYPQISKTVQQNIGLTGRDIDGVFGPKTHQALNKYKGEVMGNWDVSDKAAIDHALNKTPFDSKSESEKSYEQSPQPQQNSVQQLTPNQKDFTERQKQYMDQFKAQTSTPKYQAWKAAYPDQAKTYEEEYAKNYYYMT